MKRESGFAIGGGAMIALGAVLALGLLLSGAGLAFYPSYLAAAVSVVLGLFFLAVAKEARAYRAEYLRAAEEGRPLPPHGPPP